MLEGKENICNVKLELLPEHLILLFLCHGSSTTVLQTWLETASRMKPISVLCCIKPLGFWFFFFSLVRRMVILRKKNNNQKNPQTTTTKKTHLPPTKQNPTPVLLPWCCLKPTGKWVEKIYYEKKLSWAIKFLFNILLCLIERRKGEHYWL